MEFNKETEKEIAYKRLLEGIKKLNEEEEKQKKEKINELDSFKAVKYFKLKKNLKMVNTAKNIAACALALTTAITISYGSFRFGQKRGIAETSKSTIYETMDASSDITKADDLVIISYMNDILNKADEYYRSQGKFVELKSIYQDAMMDYTNAIDMPVIKQEKDYHKSFIDSAKKFEKAAKEKEDYSFGNSKYKFAKEIDGEVYLPYTEAITDSTLPSNYEVVDGMVYVPENQIEDDIKLGR